MTNKPKRILVYGDSITWGRIPKEDGRYDSDTRYPAVLQNELGDQYEVIEEGLRYRMAKGENLYVKDTDGFKQFPVIVESHLPIDILVILLGTNDLNNKSNKSPEDIAIDLESYLEVVKDVSEEAQPKEIIYIIPPIIQKEYLKEDSMFSEAGEKLFLLREEIKEMTKRNKVHVLDSNDLVSTTKKDGVHLDAEENIILGKALADFVKVL